MLRQFQCACNTIMLNISKEDEMKIRSIFFIAIIVLLSFVSFWGCPKKAEITTTPESQKETAPAVSDAQKAAEADAAARAAEEAKARERAAAASKGLQPIYFDFDKVFVRDDARDTMKANGEWLKANPKVKVSIEGNADERGTKEYNQALGQRRATSAKKYLTDMGIPAQRISLISYGKEKPVCGQATEECWQKNRRDDFIAVTE